MKPLNKGDGFGYQGKRWRVVNITNEGYYCREVDPNTPAGTPIGGELVLFTKEEIRLA